MTITESQLKWVIRETISRILSETNRIQPWAGNSKQADVDWTELRREDDEWNDSVTQKSLKVDSAKQYKDLRDSSIEKHKIKKYQQELSQRAQERAKQERGSDYISIEEIGDMPDAVRAALGEMGLQVGIHGKAFAYGNKKLPPSTLIVNITSSFGCPSKDCPLAQKICYAKKIGKMRKNTELRDMRNQYTYPYLTVREILQLLEMYIELAPVKIHDIRIGEAGDFENQEQVDLCNKLAGHLKAKYGISTTVYTHATSLDFSSASNLIINASSPYIKGADRFYFARNKQFMKQLPTTDHVSERKTNNGGHENFFKCCCDCYKCRFCYNTPEENGENPESKTVVYAPIH